MPNTYEVTVKEAETETLAEHINSALEIIGEIAQTTPLPAGLDQKQEAKARVGIIVALTSDLELGFKTALAELRPIEEAVGLLCKDNFKIIAN